MTDSVEEFIERIAEERDLKILKENDIYSVLAEVIWGDDNLHQQMHTWLRERTYAFPELYKFKC